jgi:hypothetical protein
VRPEASAVDASAGAQSDLVAGATAHLDTDIEAALEAGRTFEAVDLARALDERIAATPRSARRSLPWLIALVHLWSGDVTAARDLVEDLERSPRRPVRGAGGARRTPVLEELWQATGSATHLERALEVQLARARGGGLAATAAAALHANARGRVGLAASLAARASAHVEHLRTHVPERAPERLLVLARFAHVQGDARAAGEVLRALAEEVADRPLERSAIRRALFAPEAYGIDVPHAALDAFRPPSVTIYCGVRDASLAGLPEVKAAIEEVLANGWWRRREVTGPGCSIGWRRRPRSALGPTIAKGYQLVVGFGNRAIDGTARLRAQSLGTQPYLAAACESPGPPARPAALATSSTIGAIRHGCGSSTSPRLWAGRWGPMCSNFRHTAAASGWSASCSPVSSVSRSSTTPCRQRSGGS